MAPRPRKIFPIQDPSPELVNLTASFLPCTDIKALRQTCQYVNNSTIPSFASKTLSCLGTQLSGEDLKIFEALAKDTRVAPYTKSENANQLGTGSAWERDSRGCLIMQQATVQRWYNVLKSLPNCQYFHFYKDRKAATEDNKVTEPLTLGDAITIFLTFCVQLERPIKGSHILNLGTYSADEALEVPDLRGLSMAPVQLPGFKKTLSTVEDMTIGHKSVTASSVPSVDFDFSLLWHALQLKELRINFEAGNGGADMIARLAATAPDHPFSLEILYIEDTLGIRGQDLQAILSRHRSTLQKLIFCFVTMNEGDWEDTLLFMAENTFPQLQGVTFFHISEGSPADAYFLEFPGLEGSAALVDKETGSSIIGKGAGVWDGPHRPVHAEYHGPKVNVADRKLASAAAIFSPYLDDL